MKPSRLEFIDELCRPRLMPLVAALATVVLVSWWLDGWLDVLLKQRFEMENRFVDGSSFISHRLLKPAAAADFTVVMLGGSVTREAALPEAELRAEARRRFGMDVAFLNLASSDQSLGESLGIVDTLDLSGSALLVQQFSFKMLDFGPDDLEREYLAPRITGLNTAALSEGVSPATRMQRELMPPVLLYRGAIEHYLVERVCHPVMLLSEGGRQFCFRPIPVKRTYYTERDRLSPEAKADYANDIRYTHLPRFLENREFSMRMLGRIVRLARTRGMDAILVNHPIDPAEVTLSREADRAGFEAMAERAETLGRYVDLRFRPEFDTSDFRDSMHLLPSGKQKYSAILMSLIEDQLNERRVIGNG
jgi:hypothetical protein